MFPSLFESGLPCFAGPCSSLCFDRGVAWFNVFDVVLTVVYPVMTFLLCFDRCVPCCDHVFDSVLTVLYLVLTMVYLVMTMFLTLF